MASAFTHYWQKEDEVKAPPPSVCTQAFSTQFRQRGVTAGDRIFFISYHGGRPYLVGAITAAGDPVELDNGEQQITAAAGSGSMRDFNRDIPINVARGIKRQDTGTGWKFITDDRLDPQTLRGVQRITAESAALLDSLLGVTSGATDGSPAGDDLEDLYPDEVPPGSEHCEGAVSKVLVNRYERDPAARRACLEHYGPVCMVCEIDFAEWYGARGEGFIHVHHITPVSELGPDYRIDPIKDLIPVCPNCHAMLHRTPAITFQDLRKFYLKRLEEMANAEDE